LVQGVSCSACVSLLGTDAPAECVGRPMARITALPASCFLVLLANFFPAIIPALRLHARPGSTNPSILQAVRADYDEQLEWVRKFACITVDGVTSAIWPSPLQQVLALDGFDSPDDREIRNRRRRLERLANKFNKLPSGEYKWQVMSAIEEKRIELKQLAIRATPDICNSLLGPHILDVWWELEKDEFQRARAVCRVLREMRAQLNRGLLEIEQPAIMLGKLLYDWRDILDHHRVDQGSLVFDAIDALCKQNDVLFALAQSWQLNNAEPERSHTSVQPRREADEAFELLAGDFLEHATADLAPIVSEPPPSLSWADELLNPDQVVVPDESWMWESDEALLGAGSFVPLESGGSSSSRVDTPTVDADQANMTEGYLLLQKDSHQQARPETPREKIFRLLAEFDVGLIEEPAPPAGSSAARGSDLRVSQ